MKKGPSTRVREAADKRAQAPRKKPAPKKSPGRGRSELAVARRLQAYELRTQGKTYREIGRAIGVSHEMASRYVRDEWERLKDECREKAEMLRDIEASKLDKLEERIMPVVLDRPSEELDVKDVAAVVRAILAIMDRRAKLFGLDSPVKIEDNPNVLTPEERARRVVNVFNPIIGQILSGEAVEGAEVVET